MVVDDGDVAGLAPVEAEDDAERVVDTDAVPAAERSLELFQMVAGARQIAQIACVVQS
jgi:hypothetical protein